MLGHIRSRTLDKFKDAFDDALKGGQGFAEAARHSTKAFLKFFDEESAGILLVERHANAMNGL